MRSVFQDVQYAIRMAAKAPSFTAVAVLSLALGIGVNSAIFGLVSIALFGSMPYPDPGRLVVLYETKKTGQGLEVLNPAVANVRDWAGSNNVFEDIGLVERFIDARTLIADGPAEACMTQTISPNLMSLLAVRPAAGRGFSPEDGLGGERTVMLSHEFWQSRFGGKDDIVGRTVFIGNQPATIVGVMPPRFRVLTHARVDIWGAQHIHAPGSQTRKDHWFSAIARSKPGVTIERAQSEMDAIAARLADTYPDFNRDTGVLIRSVREEMVGGGISQAAYTLLGAVGFVLLIACANVANLFLARIATRAHEVTIRASVGASRGRLFRQMLTESALLACCGGALGILFTAWIIAGLRVLAPEWFSDLGVSGADPNVLIFTLCVTGLTTLLFGAVPAWRASRLDLSSGLRQSQRSTSEASTRTLRNVLVVTEVALAVVLLAGTGLLLRTLHRINATDPGFDPSHIMTVELHLEGDRYVAPLPGVDEKRLTPQVDLFYSRLLEGASALARVEAAAYTSDLPDTGTQGRTFTILGQGAPQESERPRTAYYEVTPGFFKTMRVPLRLGRLFDDNDRASTQWTTVIDEAFAARHFPGQNPVGQFIRFRFEPYKVEEPQPRMIVGVVGNVNFYRRATNHFPVAYASSLQQPATFPGGRASAHLRRRLLLRVRDGVQTASVVPPVRSIVADLDRQIPVRRPKSMEQVLAETDSGTLYFSRLLAVFGIMAAMLAAIGIYGVTSYSVAERRGEISIRMALGAARGTVLQMVLLRALALAGAGIVLGIAAALGLTRLIGALLFGVEATDPLTYAAVGLLLGLTALVASYLPARRAAMLDPACTLKYE